MPEQSRVISATTGDVRVVCVYVVNGKAVGDPAYEVKLAWLDALRTWLASTGDPSEPLLVCGDFNVTLRTIAMSGIRSSGAGRTWRASRSASGLRALESWGLVDLGRAAAGDVQGPFSYWDYTAGAFHKGWGLRIDLALGSAPVASRLTSVEVDRNERKPTAGEGKPSDHAPVIVSLGCGMSLPDPLVTSSWLAQHLRDPSLQVVDVRWSPEGGFLAARRAFEEDGHLPGAIFVDLDRHLSATPAGDERGRHPLPEPEAFAARWPAPGWTSGMDIVVVDDVQGSVAARLWWMLSVTGRSVAMLDGGLRGLDRGRAGPGAWPRIATRPRNLPSGDVARGPHRRCRRRGAHHPGRERTRHRCPGGRAVPRRGRAARPGGRVTSRGRSTRRGRRTWIGDGTVPRPRGAPRAGTRRSG